MSGDCPPGLGAKRGERGSKADGGRVRTAVRPDLEAALQCARPRLAMAELSCLFHFEPCLTPLHSSSSYTSDLISFPSPPPSPLFFPACAESPPSSLRGTRTSLNVAPLPTMPTQVHPPVRPSSLIERPLVGFWVPSPGLLSQPNDRRDPQSQLTHHRLPRRARFRFAHQMMTVLPI